MKERTWEKERKGRVGLGLEDTQQRKGVRAGGEGLWAWMRLWHVFRVQREVCMECDRGSEGPC